LNGSRREAALCDIAAWREITKCEHSILALTPVMNIPESGTKRIVIMRLMARYPTNFFMGNEYRGL
jgi:hypothetical protein